MHAFEKTQRGLPTEQQSPPAFWPFRNFLLLKLSGDDGSGKFEQPWPSFSCTKLSDGGNMEDFIFGSIKIHVIQNISWSLFLGGKFVKMEWRRKARGVPGDVLDLL